MSREMDPKFKEWVLTELKDNRELLELLSSDPKEAGEMVRNFFRQNPYPYGPVTINMGHDPVEVICALRHDLQ